MPAYLNIKKCAYWGITALHCTSATKTCSKSTSCECQLAPVMILIALNVQFEVHVDEHPTKMYPKMCVYWASKMLHRRGKILHICMHWHSSSCLWFQNGQNPCRISSKKAVLQRQNKTHVGTVWHKLWVISSKFFVWWSTFFYCLRVYFKFYANSLMFDRVVTEISFHGLKLNLM